MHAGLFDICFDYICYKYLCFVLRVEIEKNYTNGSLFHDGGPYHIETSPLISSFYMMGTFVMKGSIALFINTVKDDENRITSNARKESYIENQLRQSLFSTSACLGLYHLLKKDSINCVFL